MPRSPAVGRASGAPSPAGLPTQLTSLVGREQEVEEVRCLLAEARLLTLTGAGGSGKTRLALEVARAAAGDFPDGTAWVELAPLAEPELVPQQILAALGRREEPDRPVTETLLAVLEGRRLLLALDNCEHLVDACARLVETLLRTAPGLTVLSTSREALGLAGERVWLVPPLSLPQGVDEAAAADVAGSEAVRLFVERAQAVSPFFDLTDANAAAVARICRRLDGLPLAIELAAARVRVLTPEEIDRRLTCCFQLLSAGRTALPRHRTLTAAIDWSHELLGPEERILLRRLAIAGSFDLESAEAVCAGDGIEPGEILDLATALVDKSLLTCRQRRGESRYRLLQTVRRYALERLAEAGELEELRRRHGEHFIAMVEDAEPHVFGGASHPAWLARLEAEIDNLRTAADWCEESGDRGGQAQRLAAGLLWFWYASGSFQEGRRRLKTAAGLPGSPRSRGRALAALGQMALWQGDLSTARPALEESVTLLSEIDDPPSQVFALAVRGAVSFLAGQGENARRDLERAVGIVHTLPESVLTGFALYWQGLAAQERGEENLAESSFREALGVGRRLGNRPCTAHPLTVLGRLLLERGDLAGALDCFRESLTVFGEISDRWGLAQALEGLARIAAEQGQMERSVLLLAASETIREGLAAPLLPSLQEKLERLKRRSRAALGEAAFAASWTGGRATPLEQIVAYALGQAEVPEMPPESPPPERAASEAAPPRSSTASAAVPPLEVRALGPLEILQGGAPLTGEAAGSNRARELLLFLLCSPGGATKEEVGLALWPDASPGSLRNTFHVNLHRLRRALGHPEWIVLDGERYRVNPAFPWELDADRFERETERALVELSSGGGELLTRALALYRGDFLAGEPVGDWHLDRRDRLERLYLEALEAGAGAHLAAGRLEEAAELCRRLLAKDELHEGACRQLMVCLARLGRRSEALRLYPRLADALRRELDADPDDETTELFESLQSGARVGSAAML